MPLRRLDCPANPQRSSGPGPERCLVDEGRPLFWEAFDKKAEGRLLITETQIERISLAAENLKKCPEAVQALSGRHDRGFR